ncbi:MAG: beta-ketoacyl-ACP synthase II [Chloroflexi bacterium]|nr:beta-ketoacyl-ACP synthase II [Chloroflexota bacterium]
MSPRRVVITGIGAVSPIGNTREEFWQGILDGKCGAGPITRFDASDYKVRFAMEVKGFDPNERLPDRRLRHTDLFSQFAVTASIEAVDDAGLEVGSGDPGRIGVITGTGVGGLATIISNCKTLYERGQHRLSPFLIPKMMCNAASGHIAILHGFQGPNFATVSACASAQHALGAAFDNIVVGRADAVVTGGSEAAITELGIGGFANMKALSARNDDPHTASRPFTKSRDGFVMGEGAAMFVFELEARARARGAKIYCEVLGFAMNDDGHHITAPLPDGTLATRAMRSAVEASGWDLTEVDYINAHGTSTPLNDATETRAIRALFGDHADNLMVSSTKSQIGHLLGASGAVELAAVALAIERGVVPATINYQDPDPECDLDFVPNEPREHHIQKALSNCFGFGGHNACICVGRYEA